MRGELDLGSASAAHVALLEAEENAPYVALDLRELAFIDAAGLAVIMDADARAREAGRRLIVQVCPGGVRRLFQLSRADRSLEIVVEPGPERFSWEVDHDGRTVRVAPMGEFDMASRGELEPVIHEILRVGVERLVLDLRGVTFLDSTGLRMALELDAAARCDGFALELIPGPPDVQRVFELTGTLHALPFVTSG